MKTDTYVVINVWKSLKDAWISLFGKKEKQDQMMHRNQEPRVVGGNRNSMQREISQQRLRS